MGLRVALEVHQLDRFPLLGGELAERLPDLSAPVGQIRLLDNGLTQIFVRNGQRVHPPLTLTEPLLPPDGVDGPVVNEGEEEAAEGPAGGVEDLRRPPERHEGVVGDLLGDRGLTQDAEGDAVRGRRVPSVEAVEGVGVTVRETPGELVVGLRHAREYGRGLAYDAPVRRVTMYSREICGLCDEARETILAVRRRAAFEFEEILIDGDDALEREYGLRVPVVLVDGEERFEAHVDGDGLLALL